MHVKRFILLTFIIFLPAVSNAEQYNNNVSTPPLREALEFFKKETYSETIKILSGYQPKAESRAQYHFIYAKALIGNKKFHDSLEHLRNAYLYASDEKLKEAVLIERAEVYHKMKYFLEAKGIYNNFIKNYNNSEHLKKAHLGLAKSLTGMELLRDALKHYDKAGEVPEALFGKANIYQRLSMVKEADKLYSLAIAHDKKHLLDSDETQYYYGENLRMMGKLSDAKELLAFPKGSPFEFKAELSLGMINMSEGRAEEAYKNFERSLQSPDKKIKSQALINLAKLQIMTDRIEEAKQSLGEIRNEYFLGKNYDEATLELAEIYRKEGKFNDAVSLLKGLVIRSVPHKKALNAFEVIILDVKDKDISQLLDLWNSVGPWMLDISREQFLLNIADALNDSNKPFIELNAWLFKNGSKTAKLRSLKSLAGYYADLGITETAKVYLEKLEKNKVDKDEILRIKARLYYEENDLASASKSLMSIKKFKKEDIDLFVYTLKPEKNTKRAIAFYKKLLKKFGGDAEAYNKLADIYYKMNRKDIALLYYKIALQKYPDNEWASYRIATLESDKRKEIFRKISDGSSVISNLAAALLNEDKINNKLSEVF